MKRIDRVNELIKNQISSFLSKTLEGDFGLVTVLKVDVTRDLKKADVWVSIFADSPESRFEKLKELTKDIQQDLASKISLRNIPKVDLRFDRTGEYAIRIENILNKIKNHKNDSKK